MQILYPREDPEQGLDAIFLLDTFPECRVVVAQPVYMEDPCIVCQIEFGFATVRVNGGICDFGHVQPIEENP